MDELTKQWKGLSLSQREGPKFRMRSDLATTEYIIVAKFLTKRTLNMDAIAATFQPLWRSKNGFRLKNLGNHIVLFIFDSKADIDNILVNAMIKILWFCNDTKRTLKWKTYPLT